MRLRDIWPFSLRWRSSPAPWLPPLHSHPMVEPSVYPFTMPRTAVVAFSGGAGGAELGLHWAGVKVTASVEADPERAAAIRRRWGHEVHGDIRALQPASFAGLPRPWLFWASPPCKDISEVNHKGRGVDGDGLFYEAIRLGTGLGAHWLAFENVSRLRTRGGDLVLGRLEEAGYAWWAADLGSDLAGKDHERRRLFIIARRADAPDPASGEGGPPGLPWAAPRGAAARWLDVGRPGDRRCGLGHLRPEALGRHVRAYDGVSAGVAEFARRAYGDAVDPIFPFAIARALIGLETPALATDEVAL